MMSVLAPVECKQLIQQQRWDELRSELLQLPYSDIAEIIADLPEAEKGVVFRVLPHDHAANVFSYLPAAQQQQIIHSLSSEQARQILNQMTPDDRTRLLEEMPANVTRQLLEALSPEELKATRLLLGYPSNSAGRYMTPEYVALNPAMTAGEAIEHIRKVGRGKETLNVVYIVDEQGRLLEDLRLGSLILADPQTRVTTIEDPPLICIQATEDREEVLKLFERYDRIALPVTDAQGNMLGIVTVDDMLDVSESAATEDMQKLGGMEALDAPYMQVGIAAMIRKRGGWLSALFLGEMLTATAMSFFEGEIARAVVLALFVPLIISSGGNSGSQAASLIIRALALRELKITDWFRVLRRELLSGVVLGMMLGTIGFMRIILWQHLHLTNYGAHYLLVAFTVAASLIGVVLFGSVAGSMLPFMLQARRARSGHQFGPARSNSGGRYRALHLFFSGLSDPAGHAVINQSLLK